MHAVLYGTSLRVAGERDVFVEAVKDAAIGMYERDVAIRTRDRIAAVGDFDAMTPERARTLGAQYGLDYLVTEQPLDLPLAFESGKLRCIGCDDRDVGIRDSGLGTRGSGIPGLRGFTGIWNSGSCAVPEAALAGLELATDCCSRSCMADS